VRGHLRPGALVGLLQFFVEFPEAFPVCARAKGSRRLDGTLFETAQALQGVQRPARGLAKFAVIDYVDASLRLSPHDFGDAVHEEFVIRLLVDGSALLPRAYKIKQLNRTDQTAHVRGQYSVRATLHTQSHSNAPDFTTLLPRLNSSIRGKFSDPIERRHQFSDWLFWNPIGARARHQRVF